MEIRGINSEARRGMETRSGVLDAMEGIVEGVMDKQIPPSNYQVEIAIMRGPVKVGSMVLAGVGLIAAVCGAMVLGFMDESRPTPVLALGCSQMAVGVVVWMVGTGVFLRYCHYIKRQRKEAMVWWELLALGQGARRALVNTPHGLIEAMVPVDGSVPEALRWPPEVHWGPQEEGDAGEDHCITLPLLQFRRGLFFLVNLRDRYNMPVSVCVRDIGLDSPNLRLYPGMSPFTGLTVIFSLASLVLANCIATLLGIAFPWVPAVTICATVLAALAGLLFVLAIYTAGRVICAYKKGISNPVPHPNCSVHEPHLTTRIDA